MKTTDKKDSRMNVYIKPETVKRAKIQAVKEDKSLSQFVEEAIEEKVKRK
jgi:predicted HicB family RNase H-like nuclease